MNKEQEKLLEELTPEQAREMVDAGIALKKHLKALSKNQLIALLIKQVNITIEQQNVNKILADRLGLGEKNV
jgi:hypothetical protein